MNIDPLKKFLQTVNDESLSDEENYMAFTDAHRTETAEILWQREHDIKAAYEKAMSDLRAERRHYSDGLATVMRTRNAAARLQHAIIKIWQVMTLLILNAASSTNLTALLVAVTLTYMMMKHSRLFLIKSLCPN